MPLTSDQKGKQTHEIFNKKNMHSHYDIVSRFSSCFPCFSGNSGRCGTFHIRNGGNTGERHSFEKSGLDKPPVERYISWADDVLHGDFGVSYRYSRI